MRMPLAALVVVLASCAGVEPEAHDQVRRVLKDPESARFEAVAVYQVDGEQLTCGLVNAKNSMGGYVGNRSFMIKGDRLWLASSDEESRAVAVTCSVSNGVSVTDDDAELLELFAEDLPAPIRIY